MTTLILLAIGFMLGFIATDIMWRKLTKRPVERRAIALAAASAGLSVGVGFAAVLVLSTYILPAP